MKDYRATLWFTLCLCIFLGITAVECGGYAAFTTDFGTQLVVLNSSNSLTYSLCNSGSTPVYPAESTPTFHIYKTPRSGSNIAAVGFYENDVVYVCSLPCVVDGFFFFFLPFKNRLTRRRPIFSGRKAVSRSNTDGTSVTWMTDPTA